uniref:Uncharacterized protein n=1 Tax=uncultured alpha proteobacterium HF0010_30A23 TaxID=710802 RepID=E0XRM1_9PROT|nr:hypothetical protein [uncultured alpha proteobacterium HF0010_30A23]
MNTIRGRPPYPLGRGGPHHPRITCAQSRSEQHWPLTGPVCASSASSHKHVGQPLGRRGLIGLGAFLRGVSWDRYTGL